MKSIKQWLKELPEPYRAEVMQIVDHEQWLNKVKTDSIGNALKMAFAWEYTPQGYDYWFRLYQNLSLNVDKDSF